MSSCQSQSVVRTHQTNRNRNENHSRTALLCNWNIAISHRTALINGCSAINVCVSTIRYSVLLVCHCAFDGENKCLRWCVRKRLEEISNGEWWVLHWKTFRFLSNGMAKSIPLRIWVIRKRWLCSNMKSLDWQMYDPNDRSFSIWNSKVRVGRTMHVCVREKQFGISFV